jgi:D-3-phosphoglycerate dehydrogenase
MKKVLIPTKLESDARKVLEASGNYAVVQDDKTEISSLAKQHSDTYAMIVRSEKIAAPIIDLLPGLKVIIRAGAGYDNIDIKYARKKGIDVMNTPGANSNAVAEEVIAMMLADARHIIDADRTTREGKWEKKKYMGREITGKTVGIVGLGNIGQLVAKRLSGFDVKLLGYDPLISEEKAQSLNVELLELEGVFEKADYVTLHIPENKETRGMINEALLSRMKNGATLINCARAGIIDEEALRRLKKAKNLHFLNDVYSEDKEGMKSVADIADIMLPHLGASTYEANSNAARRAAEQLIELDERGISSFIVNREVPPGLDEAYSLLTYTITRLCRHLLGASAKIKKIETSFYGSLADYSDWLLLPIVRAIGANIDFQDFQAAKQYLKEMGLETVNRQTDPHKKYENSITIDLIGGKDPELMRRVSVRGTIAEGIMMISRINEFDKLYFEPKGPTVFFIYDDRPGVLGQIGSTLASYNINIEDVRNPHHLKLNQSLVIMRVNKPVSDEAMKEISEKIKAISAYYYDFGMPA